MLKLIKELKRQQSQAKTYSRFSKYVKAQEVAKIEKEEEVVVSIHGRQDNVKITQPVEPKSY